MPEDFKSDTLFGFLQMGIEISLGAAQKSIEVARNPGLQDKAQAIAGMWLEKGMILLSELKTAGGKFTEGK
jgi:hypothetical protein